VYGDTVRTVLVYYPLFQLTSNGARRAFMCFAAFTLEVSDALCEA